MDKDKTKTKTNRTNHEIIDSYDYLSNAASAQDMTGLIPSAPCSEEELDAYQELYHFLPPDSDEKNIP